MRTIVAVAIITLGLSFFVAPVAAGGKSDDPCDGENSELRMLTCYAREQTRASAEADMLIDKIAASFREEARYSRSQGSVAEAVYLRKAASQIKLSQRSWKAYRDQYCGAIKLSYTNGSGAPTDYQACLFTLGQERVNDLLSQLGDSVDDQTPALTLGEDYFSDLRQGKIDDAFTMYTDGFLGKAEEWRKVVAEIDAENGSVVDFAALESQLVPTTLRDQSEISCVLIRYQVTRKTLSSDERLMVCPHQRGEAWAIAGHEITREDTGQHFSAGIAVSEKTILGTK